MAASWTISGPDGIKPPAHYNLTLIGGEFTQQGEDFAELSVISDYDADPVWAHNEAVTIYRNGVRFFSGNVTLTPRSGSPGRESHSYIITGPWREFGRTYHQSWAWGSGSLETTQIVLG